MTVIHFDFAKSRRDQEVHLITLAGKVLETKEDPHWGPLTVSDLIDLENECQANFDGFVFDFYRDMVAAVVDGTFAPSADDSTLYLDPACHARALEWARSYLAQVNETYGLKLGESAR